MLRNCLFVSLFLIAPHFTSAADPVDPPKVDPAKAAEELSKALKDADAVFAATIGKVTPVGSTNSIPASVFGDITFKDAKALRGELPVAKSFSYAHKEGVTMNLDLDTKGTVLVAVKGKGVVVIVPATEANLALAKKAAPMEKK